jgi:predicted regulator of Ras-like GTPase activity (Roadblock/LC7/MglB family)
MDAAEALADLIEISTQIKAAVLVEASGEIAASAGVERSQAEALARGGRELLDAAAEATGGAESRERLVQLQAATPSGSVFVVQDGERVVVAVTAPEPTVGLLFYDLKTCLRHAAGESLAPKPRPRTAAPEEPEEREEELGGEG